MDWSKKLCSTKQHATCLYLRLLVAGTYLFLGHLLHRCFLSQLALKEFLKAQRACFVTKAAQICVRGLRQECRHELVTIATNTARHQAVDVQYAIGLINTSSHQLHPLLPWCKGWLHVLERGTGQALYVNLTLQRQVQVTTHGFTFIVI